MALHESIGVLHASFENGLYRLALDVDPGIVEVARALIPRYVRLNRTRFAPHVSVVRETAVGPAWGRHHGEEVRFTYDFDIQAGDVYWWLCAESPRLREVRVELGLPPMDWYTRPPDNRECFHITVGNNKGL